MENKSYLRKKWENFFIEIISKRIIDNNLSQEILIIKDKNGLEKIKEKNKHHNLIAITIPLNNFDNLVEFFKKIDKSLSDETKLIVNYYSIIWRPFFYLLNLLGITNHFKNECFFSRKIFEIFLQSTNYEISHYIDEPIIPIKFFGISKIIDLITNIFPFLKILSVTKICYLKKRSIQSKFFSKKTSIIIPCKNEEKNIESLVSDTKNLEFNYELIFIDDKSDDATSDKIKKEILKHKDKKIKLVLADGLGKYKAVKKGLIEASGYYSVIFDADITIDMSDLNLFVKAISEGRGDLINGSRLIYKPYAGAMKTLNYFGNIFFANLVSYITKVKITDTLCGTKCFKTIELKKFDEFEKKK